MLEDELGQLYIVIRRQYLVAYSYTSSARSLATDLQKSSLLSLSLLDKAATPAELNVLLEMINVYAFAL